jgi:hypothetical protein
MNDDWILVRLLCLYMNDHWILVRLLCLYMNDYWILVRLLCLYMNDHWILVKCFKAVDYSTLLHSHSSLQHRLSLSIDQILHRNPYSNAIRIC